MADVFGILLALLFGCLAGIVTGLTPGIHVNTVAALVLAGLPFLSTHFSLIALGVFLVTMVIVHTFLDFIPSIFLGAPDEGETALSVLPGHKLLLEGQGYKALKLTVVGAIGAFLVGLVALPLFFILVKYGYQYLSLFIAPIIIIFSAFFILTEKKLKQKIWALLVFLLSGVLGLLVLNTLPIQEPLFPLLAGLFGISTLVISMFSHTKIVEQKIDKTVSIGGKQNLWNYIKANICCAIMSVLPALGGAQATILAQALSKKKSGEDFLVMVGGINVVSSLFVLSTLYLLGKARTGVIAVMKQFLELDFSGFSILLAASIAAVGISIILTLYLGRFFANRISKVNYRKLSLVIIAFICILIALFSGPAGLFVLSISTAIGLIAPRVGIKRIHAMGSLAFPTFINFI